MSGRYSISMGNSKVADKKPKESDKRRYDDGVPYENFYLKINK